MRGRVVGAALVAWCGLAACSSASDGGVLLSPSTKTSVAYDAGSTVAPTPVAPSRGVGADDAGQPIASPPREGDAGATGCDDAVVCDDFEEPSLGVPDAGATWSIVSPDCSGAGVIAVDDTQAHSGARSLRVTGAAGYCNHVFFGTSVVAQLAGAVWARFFVRFATPLDTDHATFLAMHDANGNDDLRMGGQDSVLMWNRQSDDATLPEMSPAGTALSLAPSPLAWHCVELSVNAAGPTLQTWVDGSLVPGLMVGSGSSSDADGQWVQGASWAPRLVDARFGWESYAGESETLWFDDVAIGPSRIGCGS
jgi:hypothetical protein